MYPSQQNATDQTANFFWMLCLILAAGLILWWVDKKYIITILFYIRGFEIDLVKWFADGYTTLAQWLHLPMPDLHHSLGWWQNFIAQHPNHENMKFAVVTQLSSDVGKWMGFPVAIILIIMACILYTRHSTARFVRSYSMDSLRKLEVENWPQISPVINLDLVKQDLDKGPWAMSALPLDYCKRNELIAVGEKDGQKIWVVKKAEASRQFVLQVGQLWPGLARAPIHLQALCVVFMARAEHKRDLADKLLIQIASSSASGKLNFTGVKEATAQFQGSRLLRWLEDRHAFTTTLMASMLEVGRSDGVLATSEFLWLKPVDRRMWYILNTVGRQTAMVEVAGAYAHWLAEKKLHRRMKTPMVKMAVSALEETVENILYVDEGESWRSNAG
ncbi:MAG: type IVB secretion system coupling complex protein DotM/IcmP [Coxiellaceae bacterium]|nr:type IVB secretion system coupling complex protein DotM/IcmP [Coxiellaceae bacterium]